MGPQACQLLVTLCVTSSLALFARGGASQTGAFCLRTMSYCRPTAIVGPIFDTVVVSCDVAGASCDELGWRVNLGLLCL
jgi:hypothetical protein